jgi:hypothetical protein
MASKKVDSTKSKASSRPAAAKAALKKVVKVAKPAKVAVKTGPRHPRAKVIAAHGSKAELAEAVARAIATQGQDAGALAARLKGATNAQLLRLKRVADAVKEKWGSREKLIDAIGAAYKKSKDQDYLAKLGTYSLPRLVDLAARAARA